MHLKELPKIHTGEISTENQAVEGVESIEKPPEDTEEVVNAIQEKANQPQIEVFEDMKSTEKVARVMRERIESSREQVEAALKRLEQGQDFETSDYSTIIHELHLADFSPIEIRNIMQASAEGNLAEILSAMISEEKKRIEKRLDNQEFKEGLSSVYTNMTSLAESIGKTDTMQERWPKVVYAGKVGRMVMKTDEIDAFTTHCMAMGEYVAQKNEAHVFLASESDDPAGKAVLETQVHETVHAVSKNNLSNEGSVQVNESGFGRLEYNNEDPLKSIDGLRGLNEGVTEYFTRKFSRDAFDDSIRPEHSYDPNVKSLESFITYVSKVLSKDTSQIEKEIFNSYMNGDSEGLFKLWDVCVGKFGKEILGAFPQSLPDFLDKSLTSKQSGGVGGDIGGNVGQKLTLNFESIANAGVSPSEFVTEYPFVRLIKYDVDPQTFEMVEVEL